MYSTPWPGQCRIREYEYAEKTKMVKRQGQKCEFRQVGGRCSQNSEFLQGNSCFDIGLRSFKTFELWVGGSYL